MLQQLWRTFFRSVRSAFGRVLRAGLLGLLAGALVAEVGGFAVDGSWPPRPLVHVAAVGFAFLLSYSAVLTVALIEGDRGLAAAASHLDDVVMATADAGLNVLDAVVDAVDGPERHGIR